MSTRPRVVCLSGSLRFREVFEKVAFRLSCDGCVVLSVAAPPRGDDPWAAMDEPQRLAAIEHLAAAHRAKIGLADELLVIDVDGYVGESTNAEIEYAERTGTPVRYLSGSAALAPMRGDAPRLHEIVLDCDDTLRSARFWAGLTGADVTEGSDERWASVTLPSGARLAFQRVAGHRPPQWPDGLPQQVRLNWTVVDIEQAHERAVALGARPVDPVEAPVRPVRRGYRVYLDPAGHPFCLCRPHRGAWD